MKFSIASIPFLIMLWCGCAPIEGPVDMAYLEQYVQDDNNGLIRSRIVNGTRTTVKLVPPSISALREVGRSTHDDSCSLGDRIKKHARQLNFVINISPDSSKSTGDVLFKGVSDIGTFNKRALDMNFAWERTVELNCGGEHYTPVLSTLENTYGLTKDRNVVLVFAPRSSQDTSFYNSEVMDLIVHDQWFGSGSQHFKFHRADLEKVPPLTDM